MDIVTASSLNIFKNKLDRHLRVNWGLECFNKNFKPCLATVSNCYGGLVASGKYFKRTHMPNYKTTY